MLRISKMADYAIVLMAELESHDCVVSRDMLSKATTLPQASLRKLLGILVKTGLVESVRGINGGYQLSRPAQHISLVDIIEAIDGSIAITECVQSNAGDCSYIDCCRLKSNWQKVNQVIVEALRQISLQEMQAGQGAVFSAPGSAAVQLIDVCKADDS